MEVVYTSVSWPRQRGGVVWGRVDGGLSPLLFGSESCSMWAIREPWFCREVHRACSTKQGAWKGAMRGAQCDAWLNMFLTAPPAPPPMYLLVGGAMTVSQATICAATVRVPFLLRGPRMNLWGRQAEHRQ